jgi:hypothetical protein
MLAISSAHRDYMGTIVFCSAKCRQWPIASIRGNAAFGRFRGQSGHSTMSSASLGLEGFDHPGDMSAPSIEGLFALGQEFVALIDCRHCTANAPPKAHWAKCEKSLNGKAFGTANESFF